MYARCFVGPSGMVSLVTWASIFRDDPCVDYVCPSYSSWALIVLDILVHRTEPQSHWLWELDMTTADEFLCWDWTRRVEFALVELCYLQSIPFGSSLVELIGWGSGLIWSWSLDVLFLESFRRGTGQCLLLILFNLEPQNDLQLVTLCAVFAGAWERLFCEWKSAATGAGYGVT